MVPKAFVASPLGLGSVRQRQQMSSRVASSQTMHCKREGVRVDVLKVYLIVLSLLILAASCFLVAFSLVYWAPLGLLSWLALGIGLAGIVIESYSLNTFFDKEESR